MRLNWIKWRNMFCYGNNWQELRFDDRDPGITQILGRNGSGKSTIINIIKLGMYLKTDGITMDQIANQINGNGEVIVNLDSDNGGNWTIHSQYSPNKLAVYKDGSEEPEKLGGLAETKLYVQNHIMDVPYSVFVNTLSLSIGDFKSFLSMKAKDSRNIRDRLFGFYVLNNMSEALRTQMNKITDDINRCKTSADTINSSIQTSEIQYNELKEKIKEDADILVKELEGKKQELADAHKLIEDEMQTLRDQLTSVNGMTIFLQSEQNREVLKTSEDRLKLMTSDLELMRNDVNDVQLKSEGLRKELELQHARTIKQKADKLKESLIVTETASADLTTRMSEIQKDLNNTNSAIDGLLRMKETVDKVETMKLQLAEADGLCVAMTTSHGSMSEYGDYLTKMGENRDKTIQGQASNKAKIEELESHIKVYAEGKCPTCDTDLTDKEHADHKAQMEETLEIAIKKRGELAALLVKVDESITAKRQLLQSTTNTYNTAKGNLYNIITQLHKYTQGDASPITVLATAILKYLGEVHNGGAYDAIITAGYQDSLDKASVTTYDAYILSQEQEKKIREENELKRLDDEAKRIATEISNTKATIKASEDSIDPSLDLEKAEFSYSTTDEYSAAMQTLTGDISKRTTEIRTMETNVRNLELDIQHIKGKINEDARMPEGVIPEGDNIDLKLDWVKNRVTEINSSMAAVTESLNVNSQEKMKIDNEIKALLDGTQNEKQMASVKELIDKFREQLRVQEEESKKLDNRFTGYAIMDHILSDEGVKSFILKDVVPAINNEVADQLSLLDIPITVMFDNEFQTHLYRFGKEVQVGTISVGQRKMIDSCITFSITKILKMKYNSINVVFYDEIFSSIDSENRVTLLEMCKNICVDQLKLHTMVVNHAFMPSAYFSHVMRVTYENNFSNMELLTQDEYEHRLSQMESGDTAVLDVPATVLE